MLQSDGSNLGLWQPELADFIQRSILVHKEIGSGPKKRTGHYDCAGLASIAGGGFSIEPSVFDERP